MDGSGGSNRHDYVELSKSYPRMKEPTVSVLHIAGKSKWKSTGFGQVQVGTAK